MTPNKLHNFSILVIDDEPVIQRLVQGVLVSLGFGNVTIASSGRKAQDLISKNSYDIIVTDWRMDDIDGMDIVNFVRSKNPPFCNTPIIMLTGNTEAHYVQTAIGAGVNGYLIKPFSADQLVKRIRLIIENPRDFVISKMYKGPDRRHADQPPPEGKDRRRSKKK